MKKILFTVLSALALFSSCADGSEAVFNDPKEIRYPVNFSAQLPKFEVADSPLRAVADGQPTFYNIVVYTDKGQVYYQSHYDVENQTSNNENVFAYDGTKVSTTLHLQAGKYHVAFLIHRKDSNYSNIAIQPIDAKDYNTDTYGNYVAADQYNSRVHNNGIYYNTVDMTVAVSNNNQSKSVELQPMWSSMDININDAQTFEVPKGTNAIQFDINPLYYGFSIKTKLGILRDEKPIIVSLESIRSNATFTLTTSLTQTAVENNKLEAKIHYLKIDTDTVSLDTQELIIPQTSLENGYQYDVEGALGSLSKDKSMNITLGEFNTEDVVIEF